VSPQPIPRMPRSRANKGTTRVGYKSPRGQTVVRKTDLPGSDHNQVVYVLRCQNGHEYGANGSDIHLRVCPYCNPHAQGRDLLRPRF
jgi:hypothetical protein